MSAHRWNYTVCVYYCIIASTSEADFPHTKNYRKYIQIACVGISCTPWIRIRSTLLFFVVGLIDLGGSTMNLMAALTNRGIKTALLFKYQSKKLFNLPCLPDH